jgi:hypothetical protein
MTGLSAAGEAAILAPLTTGISGGTAYISLHTGDPGSAGTLLEVSGNNYTRVAVSGWVNTGSNPTVAQNSGILTYPQANPSGWGTISNFGVWTAATSGTYMGSGGMTTPKTVNAGDTARFAAGALTFTAD